MTYTINLNNTMWNVLTCDVIGASFIRQKLHIYNKKNYTGITVYMIRKRRYLSTEKKETTEA